MADIRDITVFSSEGEKILGVVIEHYTNPLDDFYLVYSDYALHKFHNPEENAEIILDNVIIPACDAAIAEYRLKRQHLSDMNKARKELDALVDAITSRMGVDSIFEDEEI